MRQLTCSIAFAATFLTAAALAEEASDPNAATNAETARFLAETGLISAKTANQKAKVEALGLPKFEGKTTADASAGKAEASLMVAAAATKAATNIAARVRDKTAGKPVLLLTRDEAPNLQMAALVRDEIEAQAKQLVSLATAHGCTVPSTRAAAAIPVAAIGATLGLPKTDTDITGVEVAADDRLLVDALAAQEFGRSRVVFADVLAPDVAIYRSKLVGLQEDRNHVAGCIRDEKRPDTEPGKSRIAALTAAGATVDAFVGKVTTPDSSGWTPVLLAARAAAVGEEPLILRVHSAQASGTVLKRSNLWTMIGAPAVAVSGMLVVSFRLGDPTNGQTLAAATLACRTTLADIRKVQTSPPPDGQCVPPTGKPTQ